MFDLTNYTLRLKLSAFMGSRVVELENREGVMEKGIFIPIGPNGVWHHRKSNTVHANCFVNELSFPTTSGASHYVLPKIPKTEIDKLHGLGYKVAVIGELYPTLGYKPEYAANKGKPTRLKIEDIK